MGYLRIFKRLIRTMSEDYLFLALLFCLIIISATGCKNYPSPKTELCIAGNKAVYCNDLRRQKNKQNYDRSYKQVVNYICTNPSDFGIMRNYCSDLRRDLIKCKANIK